MLAVLMLAGLLTPLTASAATKSGSCGKKAKWTYDGKGTLTISGTGAMKDYSNNSGVFDTPWWGFRDKITRIVIKEGITTIGANAFAYVGGYDMEKGRAITFSLSIPSTVKKIGEYAFSWSSLDRIYIPDTVSEIGRGAFVTCQYATDIYISRSLTVIPDGAFQMCAKIDNVMIPFGVETIESGAFTYCNNLKTIYFPSSLKTIRAYAFNGTECMTWLDVVYYNGTEKAWYKNVTVEEGNDGLSRLKKFYTHSFTDLPEGGRCTEAVEWAYAKGIVKGTSDSTFAPTKGLTRGEFCTMLWRMWGKPSVNGMTCPFTDARSSNHYKAILWAYNKGIIKGYTVNGVQVFRPSAKITRGNILVMLFKLAKKESTYQPVTIRNPYSDVKDTNSNITAYKWAYQFGITEDTLLKPTANCTRGQMVEFLFGYNNQYKRVK